MDKRLKPTKRKLIQLYAALLYNAHARGLIEGNIYTGALKNLCVPGLNCYSCPAAVGACPLGALQNALACVPHRAPWYVMGILMLYGLILGRTICGWLCPFGLIQELLHKLPTPKIKKNRITRLLSGLKYVLLAVLVFFVPLVFALRGRALPAFCKYICPAGTLEGAIGLLANPVNASKRSMLGALFARKAVILTLVVLSCLFLYRAFCRFLCPLGALYGLFAKLTMLGVRVDTVKCNGCGACVAHCRMDIKHIGDRECIHCGECASVCPEKAIGWHFGSIRLSGMENKQTAKPRKRIACFAAVLLLIVLMLFVNQPAEQLQTGYEIGMQSPAFSVPLYGKEELFDSAACMGKPVVLNFWATWCDPCVNELPVFQSVYDLYGDTVSVVAIHSHLVTEDVNEYLSRQSYDFPFAQDENGSVISAFGGSTMLPMTVIIDAQGRIVYNQVGSVTEEKLKSILEPLL